MLAYLLLPPHNLNRLIKINGKNNYLYETKFHDLTNSNKSELLKTVVELQVGMVTIKS